MAATFRYILQSPSTNQYLTDTGWSSDMSLAKRFIQSDLDNLSIGEYVLVPVWTVS